MAATINAIWQRIELHEGDTFRTKRGAEFTYVVWGDTIITTRTTYPVKRSDVAFALKRTPIDGPGDINDEVWGASYIWGILHDSRIRQNDY